MKKFLGILGFLLVALTACGGAGESEGTLEVRDAWSRPVQQMAMGMDAGESGEMSHNHEDGEMAAMGTPGVIFATIVNETNTADRLLRVETDVAERVEIHRTEVDANGVAKMMPQPNGVEIPAGETVRFEPGGYHVMLMGMQRDLQVGDTFEATFVFEKAGSITVTVEVREQ
ncbi:hypothetical protein ARMA_2128 [Ardenticatena maritima]|uniref:Copper chaperone PCu(A)C n=1 Tax=Ardenticatena maritima TaxID=872965 RepID=A0A0M8K846_9CHLR|nr:copper chaperone PCu(A)C [Ardenticatena maritima]GAP63705.1 hypothetical protein ARMA_2128 [Ardenticatena maritima]